MRYIRKKELNSEKKIEILAFGNTIEGGLGEFDPGIFEEIEGDLPLNWVQYQEKPLATGPGFIQFTKKQLEIQNVANDVPSDQRVQIFQTIKSKLSNWQNTTQKNYWDFLEQMQTPFIDTTWNVFKTDILQNKNLPENLINIQTSQGEQSLGDILLFYMGLYESETRFLSKEEFEEKYVV